ncbi:hypothetical protein B0I35DRAFT_93944 [Stachybotrys elegans]|uniref:Zn(2)-C6 fungal-type domain-containing protein n=1 Tax=Stachybotrys elegans TaxID=80388 RepID=A0A8K0WNC3_9HYPO|nr:hypothetical protein B0I35DRAFT_93944 [Stachybotrys elegans]
MAYPIPDPESNKRKRGSEDNGSQPPHHPPHHRQLLRQPTPVSSGSAGVLQYFPRPNLERLGLIEGEADTFADILNLMNEYEGALDRQESLAARLGAKLTGPRLLKGIERFFDGPIKTNPPPAPGGHPISWLDVMSFSKTNANEFLLTTLPNGTRCCQFFWKDGRQVEINEDDWRLISTGALDRFSLERPFEEDEVVEMATLDILETRTTFLYKRADEIAARARMLHHRLGNRRRSITRLNKSPDDPNSPYRTLNVLQRSTSGGAAYDLHADLLQQFTAPTAPASPGQVPGGIMSGSSTGQVSPLMYTQSHRTAGQPGRGSIGAASDPGSRVLPDHQTDVLRALITQRTEKLAKGELINPPCDRCRRLRVQCVKHLTACQGCTRKHARCSWKATTEQEVAMIKQEMGIPVDIELEGEREHARIRDNLAADRSQQPLDITPSPRAIEGPSRPSSRGTDQTGIGLGGMYSPKSMPPLRQEAAPERRRTSLPPGPTAPATGRVDAPRETTPRDSMRRAQISSIISGPHESGPPYGTSSQPPARQ